MVRLIVRNASAIIGGFAAGSLLNYLIVMIGQMVMPAPPHIDLETVEGLKVMHELGWAYFIFPLLAHALGTFFGAFVCTRISWDKAWWLAITVGLIYLSGGIYMATIIPAPTWFLISDLGIAYIPMAVLGWKLALWRRGS